MPDLQQKIFYLHSYSPQFIRQQINHSIIIINMKNTKNNNKFDCQCSLFPKKSHVNVHQTPKISMKDKDALINKLGVDDHSQKKLVNKISMNVKYQQPEKKKLIQKQTSNPVKQQVIPQKNNQRKQMIPSLKNILEAPSFKFIPMQSPNAIKKTILTSEYYAGDAGQKNKNIQFSYQSNKQDSLKMTKKVSVKDLKQSINVKTAQTMKRSDSEILQKKKHENNLGVKQQKCYSLKLGKNLKALASKSITSSKNGDKSQKKSDHSEVIQNLSKNQKGVKSKGNFFFSKQ